MSDLCLFMNRINSVSLLVSPLIQFSNGVRLELLLLCFVRELSVL